MRWPWWHRFILGHTVTEYGSEGEICRDRDGGYHSDVFDVSIISYRACSCGEVWT